MIYKTMNLPWGITIRLQKITLYLINDNLQ